MRILEPTPNALNSYALYFHQCSLAAHYFELIPLGVFDGTVGVLKGASIPELGMEYIDTVLLCPLVT